MNTEKEIAIAWWRYPAAVFALLASFFLLPMFIGIALYVTNLFTPEYFKSSGMWIFILSDILGAVVGFDLVDTILLKQKYVFQAILASIVSIYSFFVAITNWLVGASTLEQLLGVSAMGVVALVYVGLSCKKNKGSKT